MQKERPPFIGRMYDLITAPFLAGPDNDIIETARKYNAKKVVDLCCGTGRLAIKLHRNGFDVKAVDSHKDFLHTATINSPGGIDFFCEDAAQTHFESGYADLTVLSFALHEQRREKAVEIFTEAMRITRKDGYVCILGYLQPPRPTFARFLITVIERLGGRDHYQQFRKFRGRGATPDFLEAINMPSISEKTYFKGNAGLFLIKKL